MLNTTSSGIAILKTTYNELTQNSHNNYMDFIHLLSFLKVTKTKIKIEQIERKSQQHE